MAKTFILLTNQFTLNQELHIFEFQKETKKFSASIAEIDKILEQELKSGDSVIVKGKKEFYENSLPALNKINKDKVKWIKREGSSFRKDEN